MHASSVAIKFFLSSFYLPRLCGRTSSTAILYQYSSSKEAYKTFLELKRLSSNFVKKLNLSISLTVTIQDFINISFLDDCLEQLALLQRVFPMIETYLILSRALATLIKMHLGLLMCAAFFSLFLLFFFFLLDIERERERQRERERGRERGRGYSSEQVR